MKIWFGEFKGKEPSEMPDHYLKWLTEDAMPPIAPNHYSLIQQAALRERWKDLLSEVEDEISERSEDNSA